IAGQSNASSYGEGLPLPDSYDRPDPRIMQLARRNTQTRGGSLYLQHLGHLNICVVSHGL
ncbi:hypothetical protein EIJ25_005141, partial [Escherichia coli]|nr:hypothetical protein [Escherichia coli]EEV7609861.1 hypothetical protein [Escherichia coli]